MWPMFEELLKKSGIKVEDSPWAGIRFFAFEILRAGLERAGSLAPSKLMAALKGLAIISISGSLRIDPTTGQGGSESLPQSDPGREVLDTLARGVRYGEAHLPPPAMSKIEGYSGTPTRFLGFQIFRAALAADTLENLDNFRERGDNRGN